MATRRRRRSRAETLKRELALLLIGLVFAAIGWAVISAGLNDAAKTIPKLVSSTTTTTPE